MKLADIIDLSKKHQSWSEFDSCDVWINESCEVFDLGSESCHLQYITENLNKHVTCSHLIAEGWIKLTNSKHSVKITGLEENLKKFKNVWLNNVLEKAKVSSINVIIEMYDSKVTLDLTLPKDNLKLINLF